MWSKILILSIVVGVCIAATVTVAKPPEEELVPVAAVEDLKEDLKTAETNGRQFSHGGYGYSPYFGFGGYGGNFGGQGGFGGYGGYGGSWGGGSSHHSHGGYGGYGHIGYPHGGGYGHHHG